MNVTSVYNYCPSIATYSFSLTCTGSNDCQALTSFPDVTCITTGTTTSCSNGVACSGAESNYTSISSLAQDPSGDLIEYNELFLSDYCEKSWFSVNGSNIGLLYKSNSCSNGTTGTNTTTLAGIPTGAPNSLSNVSFTSCGGGTGLPTPPRPSSSPSPIIQLHSTALDRRGLFGSFFPDLIDWVCGETSLSDIISDVLDNFESIACQLAISYLETEVEQLATPKLQQACVGQVASTVNNVVGSKIDPATNSTSVEHRLINDAYVWLLNLAQTQTCNYAYSKILQIPDLATELCPEIETSVLAGAQQPPAVHQALGLHARLMIRVMASAQTCKGTRSTAELAGSSAMKESVPVEFSAPLFSGPDGYRVPTNLGMISAPIRLTTSRTVESVEIRAVFWRRAAIVYAFLTLIERRVRRWSMCKASWR
ncbi:hypothetical protein L207DRAFT_565252 [Hyaloscypha variabilis F]|uniref:Uncharacterized protein n=1 Tax=Hyaloscypha variabilis (strain UAMH 11265 / GT02V1 / F) TaxID=1149755 RepID=A0A2J6RS61_HYAVF|nr:hypothetical protein L207DRAFT_565252 [Hyaloscypha variabilis F]